MTYQAADFNADSETLSNLRHAAKSRRLVPFVGAGFSRCLNDAFPAWDDVITRACEDLGYDAPVLMSIASHYEIGEMLKRDHPRLQRFITYLRDNLDRESLATIDANSPHWWLAGLDARVVYRRISRICPFGGRRRTVNFELAIRSYGWVLAYNRVCFSELLPSEPHQFGTSVFGVVRSPKAQCPAGCVLSRKAREKEIRLES